MVAVVVVVVVVVAIVYVHSRSSSRSNSVVVVVVVGVVEEVAAILGVKGEVGQAASGPTGSSSRKLW